MEDEICHVESDRRVQDTKGILICVILLAVRILHSSSSKHEDYSEEDLDYDKDFEKYDPTTDTGSFEGGEPHPPGPLNLRGSLRQRFAMNAALVNPERSIICSPISALLPLGKLALGATGRCLEQLLQAIGLRSLSQVSIVSIAPELLQKAMAKLEPVEVIVNLPKFKTSSQVNLNKAYQQLGLTEMFQRQVSGLENIVRGAKKLHVSKAVQKAVIEVSEHGTEASASTVILSGQESRHVVFYANHPFMYFIKFMGNQIFTGTYVN